MGRHRDPRELAEAKGATKANPQRYRAPVPKSKIKLGDPPASFDEHELGMWNHVVEVAPKGVLTGADRQIVLTVCRLVSLEERVGVEAMSAAKLSLKIACLARLGMTPVDRQKLAGAAGALPPVNDEFDDL